MGSVYTYISAFDKKIFVSFNETQTRNPRSTKLNGALSAKKNAKPQTITQKTPAVACA